ncbi:MAG: lysylphosphatidylglycerol synthase transmembrane domain-containing protein [Candidatus Limnocylindria bacterium]
MSDQPRHGHSVYEPSEFLGAEPTEVIPESEVSLARRFLNVRTVGSLVFALILLFLFLRVVLNINFAATVALIRDANPALLLAALVVYYLTFPLRGGRWWWILRKVGTRIRYWVTTEILFLSWFVNCLVPAKLGDLYRAFLLKGNFGGSASRTVGTIFVERIADVVVIFSLALAAGFWSFRGRQRPEVDLIFVLGFLLVAILVVLLVVLRYAGHHVQRFLPGRVEGFYTRFREGSTGALTPRSVAAIGILTFFIWLAEGVRVLLVVKALDLPDAQLGISAAVFVALIAALLTAIPLTPAGLGFVEAGIIGALTLYGVSGESAVAIALTDRAISILTVIVFGGLDYVRSPLVRRAHAAGLGNPPAHEPLTGT